MKIAIICAMDEELQAIFQALGSKIEKHSTHLGFDVYSTHMYDSVGKVRHELFLVLCGIGKVNAAIHTQFLLHQYTPDMVINVGVAGSLSKDLTFGDVVLATDLVHHDMDVSGFDLPLGQVPRMDVFSFASDNKLLGLATTISSTEFKIVAGRIATGDQFIDSKTRAEFIASTFNALACEMEGAAVAQTCYINKVPFLVVRAVSDMAGNDDMQAVRTYFELKNMVAEKSAFVVKQLLELIK